ncbi:hypothetical protein ACQKM9_12530 [Viridibacillus sp. NPDC093762]|uniref:hypothetical protein n=1 Tax=Viridibacillus sp. NPDC093762 TaxID=3390720 RepID=UPI003D086C7F
MVPIILTIVLLITLIFSVSILIQKRKNAGITGIKSALTPIFLYLIAITHLLAYWFDIMGLFNWSITIVLLIFGAYFTKFVPISKM